jgi:hypothetical protein
MRSRRRSSRSRKRTSAIAANGKDRRECAAFACDRY